MNALSSVIAYLLISTTAAASSATLRNPVDIELRQLIATPDRFNGKRVSVTGYFDTTQAHGCDLRETKQRPIDMREVVNIELRRPDDPFVRRLTHDYTRVAYVHVVGVFQYRKVGPIESKPVSGDPHVKGIITMQTGFGWMGLLDKQITDISVLREVPAPKQ